MKRLFILVIALALTAGVFASCFDGKPTPTPMPTPTPTEQAPGSYIPLYNVGTVTSGTWKASSIAWQYTTIGPSASLALVISDKTGTGVLVFNASPLITTPNLTGNTGVGTVTSGTWTGTSVAWNYLGDRTSAQQALRISDETGSGLLVFGTSPTITTPTITTPTVATPTFTGGLLIATTAFSGGTGVIVLGNGAVPSAMNSTIQLYATGGKLYAMDSAGTITQLTP